MTCKLIEAPVKLSRDHYILHIKTDTEVITPGQFVNIKIDPSLDPLLRRPFSVFNFENGIIDVIFKIAGKGTSLLRDYATPGDIDIMGPFGKGFTMVENSRVLLVGGGVGNAPLHHLSLELKKRNNHVTYIYGSRSMEYIYCKDRYCSAVDKFILTTDDGTEGIKGFVTDETTKLLEENKFDFIYICGPDPMMKGMMGILKDVQCPVEVSMENYFGCGVGICSGCTIRTTEGQFRACKDGPVFDGKSVKWETL